MQYWHKCGVYIGIWHKCGVYIGIWHKCGVYIGIWHKCGVYIGIFIGDRGRGRGRHRIPMKSASITTKFVSSNPVHGEVYSIQRYMIKFFSDLK
jgi:hypothetical protein